MSALAWHLKRLVVVASVLTLSWVLLFDKEASQNILYQSSMVTNLLKQEPNGTLLPNVLPKDFESKANSIKPAKEVTEQNHTSTTTAKMDTNTENKPQKENEVALTPSIEAILKGKEVLPQLSEVGEDFESRRQYLKDIDSRFAEEEYNKTSISISDTSAGLGNVLYGILFQWYMYREYGVVPFVKEYIHKKFGDFFSEGFFYPSYDKTFSIFGASLRYFNDSNCNIVRKFVGLNERRYGDNRANRTVGEVGFGLCFGVPWHANPLRFNKKYLEEFKKLTEIKSSYADAARDILNQINNKHVQKYSENRSGNLTFVSIHVRRGDYAVHLKVLYNATFIGAEWFSKAMDFFRQKFSQIVFVVVSDEPKWCHENIKGPDVYHVLRADQKLNPNQTAIDLALMRQCNHSIFDYGSYGMWGALLRDRPGGLTLTMHERSIKLKHDPDKTYLREANLPNLFWLYLKGNESIVCLSEECHKYIKEDVP